jgi:hypothetical protein
MAEARGFLAAKLVDPIAGIRHGTQILHEFAV